MRTALGFDARCYTPLVIRKATHAINDTRSFKSASNNLRHVGGLELSFKTLQRIGGDIGAELAERRDAKPNSANALAAIPEKAPQLAVVECDGGRLRTRVPGHGRGVHRDGNGWREYKAAVLVDVVLKTYDEDPRPDPPPCFLCPKHVAKLVEVAALSIAAPPGSDEDAAADNNRNAAATDDDPPESGRLDRLERGTRTVLASMSCSDEFGRQMHREAKRRLFFEAAKQAYLGDGLPWNWTIWKRHFPTFEPILDFIHALSYVFKAARAVHETEQDAWSQYEVWMTGCWRGEVEQVIEEMQSWQQKIGEPPEECEDTDPRKVLATSIGYLKTNTSRMNYPAYRQAGLPITTSWMESCIKELNYRVKGTEMFWNDPEGAEAILQIRSAGLSGDDRLDEHLATREGYAFTRRPSPTSLTVPINRS